MAQKTTDEIRELLNNANLDFNTVENRALNDYLPKIFHNCPFTEEICTTKQCVECVIFKKTLNKHDLESKLQKSRYSFELAKIF